MVNEQIEKTYSCEVCGSKFGTEDEALMCESAGTPLIKDRTGDRIRIMGHSFEYCEVVGVTFSKMAHDVLYRVRQLGGSLETEINLEQDVFTLVSKRAWREDYERPSYEEARKQLLTKSGHYSILMEDTYLPDGTAVQVQLTTTKNIKDFLNIPAKKA